MTTDEYVKERLDDELNWYSRSSVFNKNFYQSLKTAEIAISVVIPFLTGYLKESNSIKYIVGVLGLLVAIIAGTLVLFKFQEKWIEYRTTAESLKHEKYMFLTQSGPYKTDSSLSNLAERVEYLISKENSNWNQLMNKKDEATLTVKQPQAKSS
ncbi:MAG TPA: DUF4231 domain-containing protein [Puia sp.]|nr:DUF4231 domain-containing protein [Puia sp.]